MKSKKTKKALSGSVLALVLCFVMLIGTTFAWFTSSDSTAVNEIQAGTLNIDIINAEDENSLTGDKLTFTNKNNDTDILWEPGVTFKTQGFRIKNNGTLALKYSFLLNGVDGDSDLLDVIEFSVVKADGTAVDLANFEGHLTAGNAATDVLYIQGHMQEAAGNDYQGKKLEGIGISVLAAQDRVEWDSTTDQYDADAVYAPSLFASDFAATITDDSAVYDGHGQVLELKDTDGATNTDAEAGRVAAGVKDSPEGNTILQYQINLTGDKTFKNVTFVFNDTGANTLRFNGNLSGDVTRAMMQFMGSSTHSVTFENCTFIGVGVETYKTKSASFKNCKWEGVEYGRYALHWNLTESLTVDSCQFNNCAGGIYVRLENNSGNTISITNNTFTNTNHAILFGGTPPTGASVTVTGNKASGSLLGWTTQNGATDGNISQSTVEAYKTDDSNTYTDLSFTENYTGYGYIAK